MYSNRRRDYSDKIFNSIGKGLYHKLFGRKIKIRSSKQEEDFEGIDRKILYLDGTNRHITVSDRFRPAITKYGSSSLKLCELDDFTIRSRNPVNKSLEIENMKADYFLYAVVNEEEDGFCRWHLINIKDFIIKFKEGLIKPARENQNNDGNSFYIFELEDLRKFDLVENEEFYGGMR